MTDHNNSSDVFKHPNPPNPSTSILQNFEDDKMSTSTSEQKSLAERAHELNLDREYRIILKDVAFIEKTEWLTKVIALNHLKIRKLNTNTNSIKVFRDAKIIPPSYLTSTVPDARDTKLIMAKLECDLIKLEQKVEKIRNENTVFINYLEVLISSKVPCELTNRFEIFLEDSTLSYTQATILDGDLDLHNRKLKDALQLEKKLMTSAEYQAEVRNLVDLKPSYGKIKVPTCKHLKYFDVVKQKQISALDHFQSKSTSQKTKSTQNSSNRSRPIKRSEPKFQHKSRSTPKNSKNRPSSYHNPRPVYKSRGPSHSRDNKYRHRSRR